MRLSLLQPLITWSGLGPDQSTALVAAADQAEPAARPPDDFAHGLPAFWWAVLATVRHRPALVALGLGCLLALVLQAACRLARWVVA